MKELIQAALAKLDAKNDNHWTEDKLPRVEVVRVAGAPDAKREDIMREFPNFTRDNMNLEGPVNTPPAPPPAAPGATPAPTAAPARVLAEVVQQPAPVKNLSAAERLQREQEVLGEMRNYKAKFDQAYADQVALVDKLMLEYDAQHKEPVNISQAKTIRGYLEAQQVEREARGAALKRFNESGVKLSDILPQRAAIDQALAARRKK